MLWNKAAYDQAIAARKQAKERVRQFDAKRKKFKEDLEAREEAYKKSFNPTEAKSNKEFQTNVCRQFNFVIILFRLLVQTYKVCNYSDGKRNKKIERMVQTNRRRDDFCKKTFFGEAL